MRLLVFAAVALLACVKVLSSADGRRTWLMLDVPWRLPVDDVRSLCIRADATTVIECAAVASVRRFSGLELAEFGRCDACHALSTSITEAWVGGPYRLRQRDFDHSARALAGSR